MIDPTHRNLRKNREKRRKLRKPPVRTSDNRRGHAVNRRLPAAHRCLQPTVLHLLVIQLQTGRGKRHKRNSSNGGTQTPTTVSKVMTEQDGSKMKKQQSNSSKLKATKGILTKATVCVSGRDDAMSESGAGVYLSRFFCAKHKKGEGRGKFKHQSPSKPRNAQS